MSYADTLTRVETYFDRTATDVWARLTSDAPVSRVRETVRAGRETMRAKLLATLPADLTGARVLDAGCGTGAMAAELAGRGADVVAVDISPALLAIAGARLAAELAPRVRFVAADMLDDKLGRFDAVVARASLIYDAPRDLDAALDRLAGRSGGGVAFTVAPATPLLRAMWWSGRLFPRSDRAPRMVPHDVNRLGRRHGAGDLGRVTSGFYISHALEVRR